MKVAIVAPAHIPLTKDWITSLQREAKAGNADVIIVDDSNGKLGELPSEWRVFTYPDQREFLEELYEEFATIFHKSSACRVFGHIVAYAQGYDFIIGLDSDCVVPFNFVDDHLKTLNTKVNGGWINPLSGSGLYPRGFPYSMRNWRTIANMGMWENVLDLNGLDRKPNELKRITITKHFNAPAPIPFSGMNFSLTRDATFGFLFLPNFKIGDDDHRRIDDIWGGYIFQRIMRKIKAGVTYGPPVVFHDTVVIAEEDAAEEKAMYKNEDEFMKHVDEVVNNMCLVVDENTPMNEVMKDFITSWEIQTKLFQFEVLTKTFQWWEKVINKYEKV